VFNKKIEEYADKRPDSTCNEVVLLSEMGWELIERRSVRVCLLLRKVRRRLQLNSCSYCSCTVSIESNFACVCVGGVYTEVWVAPVMCLEL